jgi:hypothetical protein
MCRRTVVRLAATLMFADRNRMTGIRRKVPLTNGASGIRPATAVRRHIVEVSDARPAGRNAEGKQTVMD